MSNQNRMSVNDNAPSLMGTTEKGRKVILATKLPLVYLQATFACSERHARRLMDEGQGRPPWPVVQAMIAAAGMVADGNSPSEVVKAFSEAIK
jgi:hypothetical protein